jgi:hypothetical protein
MFVKREHLLDYILKGHLHLSKKDYGFFNNLQYIIQSKNKVTSNQNALFDKLIVKYQRQLKKLGHNIQVLQELNWHVELVPTEKTFLNAHISVEDDILVLRSPFNTHFIQDFRKLDDNTFVWDKNSRTYRSNYSTHALKLLLGAVNRHFKDVAFCPVVSNLLEDIQGYDNCVWEPTLKKINGQYIIVAINKNLYEATKDIELNNDPLTLQKLSTYGIQIDTSVTNNDRFLEFAGSFNNLIDIDDLDLVIDWITALGSNIIFARRNQILYNRQVNDEIRKKLKERNIAIHNLEDTDKPGIVFKGIHTAHYPYSSDYKKVAKIVSLVNSRPIQVK